MNTFLFLEGKSCVEGFKSFVNIAIINVPHIHEAFIKITFPKKLACLVSDRKFTFYTVAPRTNFWGALSLIAIPP